MSGVVRVYLDAPYNYVEEEMTIEEYEILRKILPDLPEEKKKAWGNFENVVDIEIINDIPDKVIKVIRFKPIKKLRFSDFEKKVPNLNRVEPSVVKEIINNTVQVHMPNNELLSFRSVDYMEDCCTDELGKRLDEGWVILAICPQPGSRRPDYILGNKISGVKL